MAIELTRLYSNTHHYDAGTIQINIPFVGNTLAIELRTKPEYANTKQKIGTLFQFYGNAQKAYDLYSGRDIIKLEIPESDKLWFSPTSFLSDNYTLTIDYTDVGTIVNGSNSVSIPEQILGLPSRLKTLEVDTGLNLSAIESINTVLNSSNSIDVEQNLRLDALEGISVSPSWGSITDKPTVITGLATWESEIESEIVSISDGIASLSGRVSTLESAAPSSSSASVAYTSLAIDSNLEINKSYLATVSGLTGTLPISPTIGDIISFSTGNFSFSIKHGNSSQRVLNNSTLTVAGANNGIVLKPYADVDIVCLGSNLWKTTYRARTINNFTPLGLESSDSLKAYTASSPNLSIAYGAALAFMHNGVKLPTGSYAGDGFLSNNSSGAIVITFAEAVILDSLKLWNGQGNYGVGASADYWIANMTIYAGNSAAGENLGNLVFANSTGTEQAKTITPNTSPSREFFLSVSSPTNVGILELEFYGKAATGGETAV